MNTRQLSLRRDVLRELTPGELGIVAGTGTEASCLDYISCWAVQCLRTLRTCVAPSEFPRC
jgi:hypothetical protein